MNRAEILIFAENFTDNSPSNYISEEDAVRPDISGMRIFENPIFAFGCTQDELFSEYKRQDIIGEHYMKPTEWLPESKTVISFFLPFTERIKAANSTDCKWPADEWKHGRVEGQSFVKELSVEIEKLLSNTGYKSLVPSYDERFKSHDGKGNKFTSNWSERHTAFACGLGTFGLSKGLITKKGICGRFGSVITELDLPVDKRTYTDIYEYCTMCGACIRHCPADCISLEEGKKHKPCSDFVSEVHKQDGYRFGCGKCQVRVPCESGIPKK